MKKLLQINVTANSGSTGRIAEGIGLAAKEAGFDSWIAYGRRATPSSSHLIKIGSTLDHYEHALESRLFDNHGLASRHATQSFLKKVDRINPDLIHLHNIHGYYINYRMLFQYIREKNIPVIWTLHDCWAFTGHCTHFSFCQCEKWKSGCYGCPQTRAYPTSFFWDSSERNYREKKRCFQSIRNMTLVSVSDWLNNLIAESFLKDCNHTVINNGIDCNAFFPHFNTQTIKRRHGIQDDETILLGVANVWNNRKGLYDFIELRKHLPSHIKIILIGLTEKQIKKLPPNIIGIEHTESKQELAEYYSASDLFLNLTYEDNYPTTNLEAISCGTPCLTYNTGGSVESVDKESGYIVKQGDLKTIIDIISTQTLKKRVLSQGKNRKSFSEKELFIQYIQLYNEII